MLAWIFLFPVMSQFPFHLELILAAASLFQNSQRVHTVTVFPSFQLARVSRRRRRARIHPQMRLR